LIDDDFALSAGEPFHTHDRPDLLGGVTVLTGRETGGKPCILIPYYAWDNREQGFMQVWLREAEERSLYLY
jgi:hypothetical protein